MRYRLQQYSSRFTSTLYGRETHSILTASVVIAVKVGENVDNIANIIVAVLHLSAPALSALRLRFQRLRYEYYYYDR